jgi:hypothetical protein
MISEKKKFPSNKLRCLPHIWIVQIISIWPTILMANEHQAYALFTKARANIHVATIKHADHI